MPEIRFLTTLPDMPSAPTWILELAPFKATETKLLRSARRLGLAGTLRQGTIEKHHGAITYVEGPWALSLYRASGGLRYHDRGRWMVDDGKSEVRFDRDTATGLAMEAVKTHDLAPSDELRLLKVTRLHATTGEVQSMRGEDRAIDVGVVFQRMIGGVPVDGPGGKIVIYLDARGEMTGFDRLWREIEGGGRPVQALHDPRFAEEDLARYWGDHPGRINVTDVRFGYFEQDWKTTQRVLQPAYVMVLNVIGHEGRFVKGLVHVTPAANPPAGQLMRPRRV